MTYEPAEKIIGRRTRRSRFGIGTSVPAHFGRSDDLLHPRFTQTGRLDCLPPARHTLETGRGSCGNAFPGATLFGGSSNHCPVRLFLVRHRRPVHTDKCSTAGGSTWRRNPAEYPGRPRSTACNSLRARRCHATYNWRRKIFSGRQVFPESEIKRIL